MVFLQKGGVTSELLTALLDSAYTIMYAKTVLSRDQGNLASATVLQFFRKFLPQVYFIVTWECC